MSKNELKEITVKAFKEVFGFAPKKSEIVLLEADHDPDIVYIMVSVGGKEWQIRRNSYTGYRFTVERYED